jgi:RNA ligase (TIGR02306 family)
MRKLATIRTIKDIKSIDGADLIEVALIDGWVTIVGKGQFKPGDWCCYMEIDSIIPSSILKDQGLWDYEKNVGKLAGRAGDRLKTRKFRFMGGIISQGLALPVSILGDPRYVSIAGMGSDVTDILGITRYVLPISYSEGNIKGSFPDYLGIMKTDEERVQNIVELIENEELNMIVKISMWEFESRPVATSFDNVFEVDDNLLDEEIILRYVDYMYYKGYSADFIIRLRDASFFNKVHLTKYAYRIERNFVIPKI